MNTTSHQSGVLCGIFQNRRWMLSALGVLVGIAVISVGAWAMMPSHGKISLHAAADSGDLDEIKWLLDHGANVNSTEYNDTPLICAAGRGHTEIVKYLVSRGADINIGREHGRSALVQAICNHYPELAKWLIERKADVNVKNKDGDTVLHYAARYGNAEIAGLLIDHGAAVNVRGGGGRTPLFTTLAFRASQRRDISVAKVLLERGADPNLGITTDLGFGEHATPLQLAAQFNYSELKELLEKYGAK
jgi:ankyrin repeat protein